MNGSDQSSNKLERDGSGQTTEYKNGKEKEDMAPKRREMLRIAVNYLLLLFSIWDKKAFSISDQLLEHSSEKGEQRDHEGEENDQRIEPTD